MELKNCVRCKTLFVSVMGRTSCPACMEEEDKEFDLIKQYLEENPSANAHEVSKNTGVDLSRIIEFLKRGKLVPSEIVLAYPCEICGADIYVGRVCYECSKKIADEVQIALANKAKEKERKPEEEKVVAEVDEATKFMRRMEYSTYSPSKKSKKKAKKKK